MAMQCILNTSPPPSFQVNPTKKSVGVSVAIGMNPIPATKLVATIESFFLHDPRWSSPSNPSSRVQSRNPRSNSTDSSASSTRRRERFYNGAGNHRDNGDDAADEGRDGPNDRVTFPVTIFLYSDFVKLFPDLVLKWGRNFAIGSRGW